MTLNDLFDSSYNRIQNTTKRSNAQHDTMQHETIGYNTKKQIRDGRQRCSTFCRALQGGSEKRIKACSKMARSVQGDPSPDAP